jgi:hypothetical protein
MLTIRCMGIPEEVATRATCVRALVEILEESPDSPNREQTPLVRRAFRVPTRLQRQEGTP